MPDNPTYNADDFGVAPDDPNRWAMNGEVDVIESIEIIENENLPAIHSVAEMREDTPYAPAHLDNPYDEWNTYGIIKQPGHIIFTINGESYTERVNKDTDTPLEWPYDQFYYIILNLAMGGPWAGSEKDKYPPH